HIPDAKRLQIYEGSNQVQRIVIARELVNAGYPARMDFEFSAEQVAIRDTIRELVQDRVAPRAAEIDQTGEYPKDIERLFADNGILGIPFPEEYGGISGSSVTICMGIEEIAKACASSSLILAVQALGSYPILVAGS